MKAKVRFCILLAGIMLFLGSTQHIRALSSIEIVGLANEDRVRHGLPELSVDPLLNLAATAKAQDMQSKNYFAHVSPEGTSPWHWFKALGYNYTYAGENLAEGFTDAQDLENSWMSSPAHRANILSPFYSEVGLAVINNNNVNMVVQFFGSRDNKVTLRQ
jgi:uncharacterized protein YkwD